jgi:hypothetical protein
VPFETLAKMGALGLMSCHGLPDRERQMSMEDCAAERVYR